MIDRRVVHRSLDSEVFLSGYTAIRGVGLRADVAIPADHARVRTRQGALSSSMTLEVFRQGAFLSAHESFDIPLEWHFVTKRAVLEWTQEPPLIPQSASVQCELDIQTNVEKLKQGRPFLLTWNLKLRQEGRTLALGELRGWALAPHRYRALRRNAQIAPSPEDQPPRPKSEGVAVVEWDDRDSFLFNRPGDHVVSMVLIDAAFEAVADAVDQGLTFAMDFRRFAERAQPIHRSAVHGSGGAKIIQFRQSGQVIAEAVVRTARRSRS